MVIESAEKFGLSQLHQLRGRVGRGAEQSYCILLTGPQLSRDATERMNIMVQTNDGFLISEKDLEIRGPGDIEGTRQSGVLQFKLANIIEDKAMLETARNVVINIIEADPKLESPAYLPIVQFMTSQKSKKGWGKIA
jgi:ATP-dependent DNA helicase RecG